MAGQSVILVGPTQREYARQLLAEAAPMSMVRYSALTRSVAQNDKMWAMIADVRRVAPGDRHWEDTTWKCAFMHHLGWQVKFCPSLATGDPFPVGYSSSNLSVKQASDLIECIYAFGAENNVKWSEAKRRGFMDITSRGMPA